MAISCLTSSNRFIYTFVFLSLPILLYLFTPVLYLIFSHPINLLLIYLLPLFSITSSHHHQRDSSKPPSAQLHIHQTLRAIDVDVRRTQAALAFFSSPMKADLNSPSGVKLEIIISQLNQLNPHPLRSSPRCSDTRDSHSSSHTRLSRHPDRRDSLASTSSCTTTTSNANDDLDDLHCPSSQTDPSDLDHSSLTSPTPKLEPIITFTQRQHPPIAPLLNVQAPSPICSPASRGPPPLSQSHDASDHASHRISPCGNAYPDDEDTLTYTFHDCLTRLLYVWSMLNPGVGYVQGMNELGALMLYVFAQSDSHPRRNGQDGDRVELWSDKVEADAFWAFTALMSSIRDIFVNSLDAPPLPSQSDLPRIGSPLPFAQPPHSFNTNFPVAEVGISRLLSRYASLLKWLHPPLSDHLSLLGLDPSLYAFNWFSCLFTHCFTLADVVRLWDPILAINLNTQSQSTSSSAMTGQEDLMDFLVDVACALTLQLAPTLLNITSFAHAIQLLQGIRYFHPAGAPSLDVDTIAQDALFIRQRRLAEGFNRAELQPLSTHDRPPSVVSDARSTDGPDWLGDDGKHVGWEEYDNSPTSPRPPGLTSGLGWSSLHRYTSPSNWSMSNSPNNTSSIIKQPISPTDIASGSVHNGGLMGKLKTRAEAWKDSDTAASCVPFILIILRLPTFRRLISSPFPRFSKQATNWTILASSWRPPTIVSKLSALSLAPSGPLATSPNPNTHHHSDTLPNPRFHSNDPAESLSTKSSRWSRLSSSSSSTVSNDTPFSLSQVHSRLNTVISPSPISPTSSTLGSPIAGSVSLQASGASSNQGHRPLLLSSRARTSVQQPCTISSTSTQEQGGLMSELSSSWRKISTGATSLKFDHGLLKSPVRSPAPLDQPLAPLSPASPLNFQHRNQSRRIRESPASPAVRILGRSRSPSMFSSRSHPTPRDWPSKDVHSSVADPFGTPHRGESSAARHSLPHQPTMGYHRALDADRDP